MKKSIYLGVLILAFQGFLAVSYADEGKSWFSFTQKEASKEIEKEESFFRKLFQLEKLEKKSEQNERKALKESAKEISKESSLEYVDEKKEIVSFIGRIISFNETAFISNTKKDEYFEVEISTSTEIRSKSKKQKGSMELLNEGDMVLVVGLEKGTTTRAVLINATTSSTTVTLFDASRIQRLAK